MRSKGDTHGQRDERRLKSLPCLCRGADCERRSVAYTRRSSQLWEILHPSDTERAATVEALKEALEDMRAGDIGIPAREFFADLRSKYGLPARP